MTTNQRNWGELAQACAEWMHARPSGDSDGPWGWTFNDIDETGANDAPRERVAIAFVDRRPLANDRRDRMHRALSVLLWEAGKAELGRAVVGDTVVMLFEGTHCGEVEHLRDAVTSLLNVEN